MKQHKKLIAFLMSAVMSVSTVLQCAGTVSAAEQQKGTAEAVPEMSASGTGGVGEVLAESINKETAKLQNAEGCNIFSIKTEDKRATVYFSAAEDCKLVVGVYTDLYEDGYEKMVVSAVTDVKAGQESAEVTFSTNSMPAYYVLKAYLIGKDGKLLSEEYVDQTYTKDIQTLMDSDINSYEGYEVLNLDENDNTNFVVYKKDVKVLHTTENENIVTAADDAAGIYSIRNVSEDIKTGDVVSVQGDSPDVVIFRVKSMETDGDLTTFEADTSMKPAEAFSYIKVEMKPEDFAEETTTEATTTVTTTVTTTTVTTTTVVTTQAGTSAPADETAQTETTAPAEKDDSSGAKPSQPRPLQKNEAVPDASDEGGWSGSKQLELESAVKDGDIPIPGIDASYSLSNFKFSLDLKYAVLFDYYCTETHTKSALYIESEVNLGLTIEAKATVYCPIPGCSFNVDKFGVEFKLGFFLKMELDGYISGNVQLSAIYDSTGFHPDINFDLSAGAEIYAGIAFKAECKVFGADVEAEIGVGARAAFSPAESHPICTVCQDIELSVEGNFEVKAGISFWGIDWGFGTSGSVSFKLSDAYWSNKLGFGLGTCPNKHISGESGTTAPGTGTNPGTGSNPTTTEPNDGLTAEQREYLVFAGYSGGYAASVNPSHAKDIESIEVPAEYKGRPVTAIGTGSYYGPCGSGSGSNGGSYYVTWTKNGGRSSGAGFEGCTKLKSVKLPETIRYINEYAFAGCTELEDINLPDSVVRIEYCAFILCFKMKIDKLPSNINEIGLRAFVECDSCFETLILPPSLKKMGNCAFANCDGIKYAELSLRAIPSSTFHFCTGLKKVVIAEPTVSIKEGAFENSNNLEEVVLPDSLRFISNDAFRNCNRLRKLILPDNLLTLGKSALEWTVVPSLNIPPLMKKINGGLLYADNVIKTIVLPENIENIDFSAFDHTSKLNSITVLNPNAEFADLRLTNDVVPTSYYKTQKTIYGYSGSTTEAFCKKYGFRFKALDAQPATVVTPVVNPETEPPKTIVFKDLEPNTLYNFYDLLGEEFTSENLLFLSQGMSDKNGTLTVWYRPAKDDTDANKFVKCYETEKAEPKVYGKGLGDLNGDNSIDVSDAVLLARFCAEDKTAVITTDGLRNADVNHDGKKDGADIIRILEYIARIISSFD